MRSRGTRRAPPQLPPPPVGRPGRGPFGTAAGDGPGPSLPRWMACSRCASTASATVPVGRRPQGPWGRAHNKKVHTHPPKHTDTHTHMRAHAYTHACAQTHVRTQAYTHGNRQARPRTPHTHSHFLAHADCARTDSPAPHTYTHIQTHPNTLTACPLPNGPWAAKGRGAPGAGRRSGRRLHHRGTLE